VKPDDGFTPFEDVFPPEEQKMVLERWGIEGRRDEVLLVSLKVAGFTVEAKAQAGPYQNVRGYVSLEPASDLAINVLVHDPARCVDSSGDVGIFGAAFRYVARELDMAVVDTANRRLDRAIVEDDAKAATARSRFEVGKVRKEVSGQTSGEVL